MNFLDAKSAPPREDRLHASIAFGGKCAQVRTCERALANGCTNLSARSFSMAQGCQFTLSLAILNTLRNAVVIMHGPIGCGICSTGNIGTNKSFKQIRDPSAEGLIWLSTNLDESDVINGGEKKLQEAVIFADREFRPDTIIVCNSCVPALIGDDIDSIIQELQQECAAIIMPVHCEGFKTKLMATAYDAVYHGILKKYIRRPDLKIPIWESDVDKFRETYKRSRNVNILNVGSMSRADEVELCRLLEALGLNVTFIPCYAEPEDFQYALETSLNVSICGTHDDYFVGHLEEKYNIPFVVDTIPIGRKNTDRWIRKIAAHFDLQTQADRLIEAENVVLSEALEPFRKVLSGKRAYLAGGEVRILATAEILQDLGMEVVGFKAHHYDKFAEPIFDALENIDEVQFSVATNQPFEMSNIINRLKPDLLITHTGGNNIAARHGLPLLPLFGPTYNYCGYSGVFEVARRLNKIMRNFEFNRQISLNSPLPFKKEWYEKDPFAYIKYDK
ncbi:oxidoreductase nitrogenase component 1 [Spirochaetia bacterium]|nr:oxidoreductase nitrogenase component 1 [Spirochaetia bacterium]GHU29290.1 oxidoreductase nitrogenase component 1 [Spirochaetia bacterium]